MRRGPWLMLIHALSDISQYPQSHQGPIASQLRHDHWRLFVVGASICRNSPPQDRARAVVSTGDVCICKFVTSITLPLLFFLFPVSSNDLFLSSWILVFSTPDVHQFDMDLLIAAYRETRSWKPSLTGLFGCQRPFGTLAHRPPS